MENRLRSLSLFHSSDCFRISPPKTRFGLAVRSAADNPGAAQLAGISIRSVSTQVWLIAGVLAGVSTLLIGPIYQLDAGGVGSSLGPELLFFTDRSNVWTIAILS